MLPEAAPRCTVDASARRSICQYWPRSANPERTTRPIGKAMLRVRRSPMLVTFARTGERRYAVRAVVEGMTAMEMDPAPGFDPLMPHDLQHFIVERALGIEAAIYGQLAAGGTVGTFRAMTSSSESRAASRERRKRDRK